MKFKPRPPGATQPEPRSEVAAIPETAELPVVEVRGVHHTVLYMNEAFCRLLGKEREELIGLPLSEMVPGGTSGASLLDQAFRSRKSVPYNPAVDADSDGTAWFYIEWPAPEAALRPTGVIVRLTEVANFRRDAAAVNEALLISGLHQHELTGEAIELNVFLKKEVKARKKAEASLQKINCHLANQSGELERLVTVRTARLRETVADLEGFSYSVAHDMRAPLSGMQGFAHILLKEHAVSLDGRGKYYLEQIARAATRMDLLIDDVLNYTKVMRSEALLTSVDLNRLVRDIVALYPAWQPPDAIIEVEGILPCVTGHEGFLTQCVSNILSNAVKFVPPGLTPHVRIWAEDGPAPSPGTEARKIDLNSTHPATVVLCFEDNGIGIAETDRERVFRLFERINPSDQFEGTGAGLTIVRKAVERMGGLFNFESTLGKGSRFWIELARAFVPLPKPTPL